MEKMKLLLADPNEEFLHALTHVLQDSYCVYTATDGIQALQLFRKMKPEILFLDLMLPGLDGITLLQRVAESQISPKILASTRYLSEYTLQAAQRLGVGYVMLKPCDIYAVADRISDLTESLTPPLLLQPDTRSAITNTLLHLGISTKLRGFGYLREAIVLMTKSPEQSITKELYPAVAALCNATSMQVERSIRSAIATAWRRRDASAWRAFFHSEDTRPTNADFICRLSDEFTLTHSVACNE